MDRVLRNNLITQKVVSESGKISLRDIQKSDLDIFFEMQQDHEANYMAAFTVANPSDRKAFDDHWTKILARKDVINRTILYDGSVAGNIEEFELLGLPSIGYWISREFWNKGVATGALKEFLGIVPIRPVFARVAADNAASRRVLEKCGFIFHSKDRGYADYRKMEVDELVMIREH